MCKWFYLYCNNLDPNLRSSSGHDTRVETHQTNTLKCSKMYKYKQFQNSLRIFWKVYFCLHSKICFF